VSYIKEANLMPVLFASKWDADKKQWKDAGDFPSDWDVFEVFDRGIRSVQFDRKTGLVTLAIEWRDPALAAKWANDLVREVNSRLRNLAIDDAQQKIGYLEKQLALTSSVEIQQAIYHLIEAQTKKKMIASTQEQYAFSVIDPAVPSEEIFRPKRLLIAIFGLLMGITFGIVLAFVYRTRG
jgi:uncharacterized protein involved in exopolysaccharide biosynthesis